MYCFLNFRICENLFNLWLKIFFLESEYLKICQPSTTNQQGRLTFRNLIYRIPGILIQVFICR